MDMQNVSSLQIPEGMVKTIHDKDSRLLWGAVGYDTKYAGDTTQVTYTGKNLFNKDLTGEPRYLNGTGGWTGSSSTLYINQQYNISGDEEISVSFSSKAGSSSYVRVGEYNGDTFIRRSLINTNLGSITTDSSTNNVVFSVDAGSERYFVDLQIEIGPPSTYEPYTGGVPSPNPDYPQPVNVVTGTQTITISDGINSEAFPVSLGSIELCKIGTYQDYIYKSGDDWYIHKEIGKTLVTGSSSESWSAQTTNVGYMYRLTLSGVASNPITEIANLRSNYFAPATGQQIYNVTSGGYIAQLTAAGYIRFNIGDTTNKLSDFKTWLSSHNTTVYYALATPTNTKITDATLAGQLNSVHGWLTRYGYNATVSGDLPIVLQRDSLQ